MNTFGLKRKVHTFGLGKLNLVIVNAYHEIQRFVLRITKRFNITTEL